MNQPTREEFEQLKAQVQRLEQQTEPIHLTDNALLQTLVVMAGTNATDNAVLKQTVERLEANMEKRFDSIAQVQKLILDRLPEKGE